jgi:hypothetical protein
MAVIDRFTADALSRPPPYLMVPWEFLKIRRVRRVPQYVEDPFVPNRYGIAFAVARRQLPRENFAARLCQIPRRLDHHTRPK